MIEKENNYQTGHESFGMTADEAAEILSKVSFLDSKSTEEIAQELKAEVKDDE